MEQLPDYGKVMFSQHPAQDLNIIFPNATKSELEFVRTVLTYARPKTIDDVRIERILRSLFMAIGIGASIFSRKSTTKKI